MVKRIMALSRAQLEAAVEAGQYRDPADAARITEILEQRRQAISAAYEGVAR